MTPWSKRSPYNELVSQTGADEVQLARKAAHDADAFEELYHRYLNRIYRYFMSRIGHVEDAQDLTAQTFLVVLERIQSFNGRGSFAAWLFGIARHKAADYFRNDKHFMPLESDEVLRQSTSSLDDQIEHDLRIEQIAHSLHVLGSDRAEVIALRVFAGLSIAETAQAMGKTEDAIYALISRAIRDLRLFLKEGESK